jgi:hypothetical protein
MGVAFRANARIRPRRFTIFILAHRLQCLVNPLINAFDIRGDLIVPETQHAKVLFGEPAITMCVAFTPVLSTVYFDDQARFETCKVRDVRSERNLPTELESLYLTFAQHVPQATFRFRHIVTQLSGALNLTIIQD